MNFLPVGQVVEDRRNVLQGESEHNGAAAGLGIEGQSLTKRTVELFHQFSPECGLVPLVQQADPGSRQPGFLSDRSEQLEISLPLRFVFLINQHSGIELKEPTAEFPDRLTDLKQFLVGCNLSGHRLAMVPDLDRGTRAREPSRPPTPTPPDHFLSL